MNALTPGRFDEFFYALYDYEPFPWQARLARRVAESEPGDPCWPEALALPTAAGKTACIDMAIFASACQAARSPAERTAPRRIFFVVDRRVIVDATFERAKSLAFKLGAAQEDDSILRVVAGQLRLLSGEEEPLACFQLRGGMYRDDAWARSPLQPTVVVTTVDQFGSRLLFRGYGSSAGMRPIHAGLAANDSLVILDEAHCANPFRQTIDAVKRYRQWAERPESIDSVPFHLTLLSATLPSEIKDIFTTAADDIEHPRLSKRLKASKSARLVEAQNARGDDGLETLAERIATEAKGLVGDERRAIGVIVNRVATARLVYERLKNGGKEAVLLTGRMRSIDRDDVAGSLESLKTGSPRDERERFVVATQTLEVGADLDFDGLATECASLDALRQRFGRLNRDGRPIEARATIVVRADQTGPVRGDNRGDPIYGTALAETWRWLKERADKGEIDFGYAAMEAILPDEPEELDKLRQRAADAPIMLPAHVDAWVQTSPTPAPDPDPSIFLHGPDRGAPEVQVCWRADLSQADISEDRAVNIVSLCPPASSECISVPIHVLRRWLEGAARDAGRDDCDLEGTLIPDVDSPRERREIRRHVLCWRGPAESRLIASRSDLENLRPGDAVVIPEEMRGWDFFGHIPPDSVGNQVIDLGDRAHILSRAKAVLRIHPKIVESWPDCIARDHFKDMAEWREDAEDDEDEDEIRQSLEALVKDLAEIGVAQQASQWEWLKDAASALANDRRWKKLPHPGGGFVLQGSRRIKEYTASASTLTSEDDSYSATVRVTLDDHLYGVERWAKRFGEGAGLPASLVKDLALAARWHDAGKADPRFQAMLRGGHLLAAQVAGEPLAKSERMPTGRAQYQRARRESGYPSGGRHELLSVRLIESAPGLLGSASDQGLALHLVASHHGYCRPFAPVAADPEPLKVEATVLGHRMFAKSDTGLERLDGGVPERFWNLVRRYGWWGLAWLEALMRLADHRRSEEEQKVNEDS